MEFFRYKRVDWIGEGGSRDCWFAQGLKEPIVAIGLGDRILIGAGGDFFDVFWPGSSGSDPGFDGLDLLFGEFFVRGHFQAFVADGLEQQAIFELFLIDDRTGVSTRLKSVGQIESEGRFGFIRAVASDAVLDQDRSDMFFEELGRCIGFLGNGRLVVTEQACSPDGQRQRKEIQSLEHDASRVE